MTLPGIYVHLPFCSVHCTYCDFPLSTRLSLANRYYDALFKEIAMQPPTPGNTLYFGGGTPSLTPSEILQRLRNRFELQDDSEITLEANPDDINPSSLASWKNAGINRLSIGVQSLQDDVLQQMLRKHSAHQAISSYQLARQAGFQNINFDLILGAPRQTIAGFMNGLQQLIDLRPEHFSIYLLEVHERTALSKQIESGKVAMMPEEDQLHCYRQSIQLLQQAGYEHYEVSNFARPGFSSRHNLKYWTSAPYYAFGAGACSYLPPLRNRNISSITGYIESLEQNQLPVEEKVQEDQNMAMRNALIFGLRQTSGINMSEFQRKFGVAPLNLFDDGARNYLERRLLEISGNQLRLTLDGLLVSNEILSDAI
jgi:oxygen-independent coproporphyrinogen-3 oxidase